MPRTVSSLIPFFALLMGLFLTINTARAATSCDQIAQQNAAWQSEIVSFKEANSAFESLLQGTLPSDSTYVSRVLAPIEIERSATETRATLQAQRTTLQRSLNDAVSGNDSALSCDEWAADWRNTRQAHVRAQLENVDLKMRLLALPPASLGVLFRELKAWQQLEAILAEVESAAEGLDPVESASLGAHVAALSDWREQYADILQRWLPLLTAERVTVDDANRVWQRSLALQRIAAVTQWPQLDLTWSAQSPAWRDALIEARNELVMGISQWRNDVIWNHGWSHFVWTLLEPVLFTEYLLSELQAAPGNFWDNLTTPFRREFRYYQRQNTLGGLFTKWGLHSLGLILCLALAIKLAESIPALVAQAQQASLQRLESTSSSRFVSGLFWFIKPNAPWLVVLIVTQLIAAWATPNSILAWIGPIGALYALFRVSRVLFEWLMSRTYSRAGEFVPPSVALAIIHDCHRFAWAIVTGGLLWWLGRGTGGGYLRYLIVLSAVVIAWWALQWLLHRHDKAVTSFLPFQKTAKASGQNQKDPGWLRRLGYRLNLPVQFLFAHLVDSIRSLNQKLLGFDSYRAFSVKLLRARLESKAEELEEEEAEPDENYSDWMIRPAGKDMVFEVGDVNRMLDPIEHWYKDKTEENVLMLVGDTGSGKTTCVDRLPDIWTHTPVQYLRFDTKTNSPHAVFDGIAEALDQKSIEDVSSLVKLDAEIEPRVLVIDDAHNLFLAEVGQFDAYKTLMQCMNAQLNNIFWVVVMHAPSWSYLSCVFAREQRISNIYRMPRWSPQEIRRLILSRHQGGKRRLRYNELLLSAAASSESSSVRGADSRVFNILWEQSAGNPTAAIELWLNAAKVKGRVVEIGVPQRPSATPLATMKNDLYFVFSAIVTHRRLSTQEIMLVTHFAEPIVRHALKQGINLGIIVREADGRYAVDAFWHATLSAFLQRKNMLWV